MTLEKSLPTKVCEILIENEKIVTPLYRTFSINLDPQKLKRVFSSKSKRKIFISHHYHKRVYMKNQWLTAFGKMTYGIYVLTSRSDDTLNGMIASWVTQISYEPPMIMAAVHPNRFSHSLLENNPVFGLHVIDLSQKDLLARFKGPDPTGKFEGLDWGTKKTGVPLLKECIAWFELKIREQFSPGNHTLFIGEVVNCGCNSDIPPLTTLDYNGMYTGRS